MAGVLEKQPWEERLFAFNFAGKMETSATITSVTSITAVLIGSGVASVTIDNITASGQTVSALYIGGTDKQTYLITCRIEDSDEQKLELEGRLRIKEIE